ncbi:uncharacterized protein C10orf143 homolog isoform X2 [Ahaetulla prasina]|uniref:uncharacterized protein C10orf143 homolog isoform X2 n=1 Tax=Ahaetulla prasina TaxID=499056 RepID=UPI00264911DA|nr:uncharacterized protein C10orf143 homolog isoform X2 [Ahaetulla prasina]XP_058044326.1 uncharacterized protein C10orf143 homolog isoform X2 [Ahaetulla prasina]
MNLMGERRRGRPEDFCAPQPERKRVCKNWETVPQAINPCHPLSNCFMDYWAVKWNLKESDLTELFSPQIMKEKPSYMIFTDNEAKATAQPCPRCIAGESGHFGHMMGL